MLAGIWRNAKRTNIGVTGVQKGHQKAKGLESLFKGYNRKCPKPREVCKCPDTRRSKSRPRHHNRALKMNHKEKILTAKEKGKITPNRDPNHSFAET